MGLFDFLKGKKSSTKTFTSGSYFETDIQEADLDILINNSISVFQDNPDFDDDRIVASIKAYKQDEKLALALYRFIPIAYCRLSILGPKYSDEYIFLKDKNEQQSFLFSTDKIFLSVLKESKKRLSKETSQDKILPILFHSADFNAINDALKNGSELKNLVCSPSYFL